MPIAAALKAITAGRFVRATNSQSLTKARHIIDVHHALLRSFQNLGGIWWESTMNKYVAET